MMRSSITQEKQRVHATQTDGAERYYLLNADFTVISAAPYIENTQSSEIGSFFFDLFPAKRALREEIDAYVRSYPGEMLLTLCGRTPLLFVGTLWAHAGMVLVVVPEGEVKRTLSYPASFHRVPSAISVSASAQMRYKAHDEQAFSQACRWLLSVSAPFLPCDDEKEAVGVLSARATRLSQWTGVPLSCDLSGLPARSCARLDMTFATGVILATLAAARRHSDGSGVQLYAALEGAPTLHLSYVRANAVDAPVEFVPLLSCAASRGMMLDVVSPVTDPLRVQIRACFGIVELSAQGVRERHRFLEGKSPLYALEHIASVPVPFPELSFD